LKQFQIVEYTTWNNNETEKTHEYTDNARNIFTMYNKLSRSISKLYGKNEAYTQTQYNGKVDNPDAAFEFLCVDLYEYDGGEYSYNQLIKKLGRYPEDNDNIPQKTIAYLIKDKSN
jgi:hypothetical protein